MNNDNGIKLSERSIKFIENLRVYLFSTGKNADEAEEIIEELEVHLYEAEKRGKPIEKIIGNSPKEYMEMISQEMVIDYRNWFKYLLLIIGGAFSIGIISDVLKGPLSYSVLEIVGSLMITLIFIVVVLKGFKLMATMTGSPWKQSSILLPIVMLPGALFFGLIMLNRVLATPVFHFNHVLSTITGLVAVLLIIALSVWAKTWILIVVVTFLTLPNYLMTYTSLSSESQLLIGTTITFAGIGFYLLAVTIMEKKNTQASHLK